MAKADIRAFSLFALSLVEGQTAIFQSFGMSSPDRSGFFRVASGSTDKFFQDRTCITSTTRSKASITAWSI